MDPAYPSIHVFLRTRQALGKDSERVVIVVKKLRAVDRQRVIRIGELERIHTVGEVYVTCGTGYEAYNPWPAAGAPGQRAADFDGVCLAELV